MRLIPRILGVFLFVIWSACRGGALKCTLHKLEQCHRNLDENVRLDCSSALRELPRCIYIMQQCRNVADVNQAASYDILKGKLQFYRACFKDSTDEACNETLIELCHNEFRQGMKPFCDEMNSLRTCVGQSAGCHVMENPWYTLSVSMIKMNTHCFMKNYSAILQLLNGNKSADAANATTLMMPTPITCIGIPPATPSPLTSSPKFLFLCLIAFLTVVIFFVGIVIHKRRTAVKYRRPSLVNSTADEPGASGVPRPPHYMVAVRCDSNRPVSDTFELPPPYFSRLLPTRNDLPPPYTSRPSSVNGEFV